PSLFRDLADFADPLGATLQVGSECYRVVGLLGDERIPGYASKALALDQKRHEVYVPFDTLVKREGTVSVTFRTGSSERTDVELNQLVLGVKDIDQVVEVARLVGAALAKRHEDRDYDIVVPIEYLPQRKKTQDVFNY